MSGRVDGATVDVAVQPSGLLRRSLLLGAAVAGVWFAGSLGHASMAEAAPLAQDGSVSLQVHQVVTGLAPSSSKPPVSAPRRPVPPLPKIVKPIAKQAQAALATVLSQPIPAAVLKIVDQTAGAVIGIPPVATPVIPVGSVPVLPVASTPPIAVPAQPVAQFDAAKATVNGFTKSTHSSIATPSGWTARAARPDVPTAQPAPILVRHAVAVRSAALAFNTVIPPGIPANAGLDQGACGDGAGGGSEAGPQPTMSIICGAPPLLNQRPDRGMACQSTPYPPRERATAPAVSPD